jgi:Right handed beta helix region
MGKSTVMHTVVLGVAALLLSSNTGADEDAVRMGVDCDAGESVQGALKRARTQAIVVTIKGRCAEHVTIERDDIVLRADQAGGEIDGPDRARPVVRINGARRVGIEGLAIRNGFHGVELSGAAAATLARVSISGAARNGIDIQAGSVGTVDASTVEGNGRNGVALSGANATVTRSVLRANNFSGIAIVRGSSADLGAIGVDAVVCCGNTIESNVLDGVTIADHSNAVLFDNTIRANGVLTSRGGILALGRSSVRLFGGNRISQNGGAPAGAGILVAASTLITGNGDTPVSAPVTNDIAGNFAGIGANLAVLDLRRVAITGNASTGVFLNHGSRLRLEATAIADNVLTGVFLRRGSTMELVGAGNSVTRNGVGLLCADGPESSFSGSVAGIVGNSEDVSTACTGF